MSTTLCMASLGGEPPSTLANPFSNKRCRLSLGGWRFWIGTPSGGVALLIVTTAAMRFLVAGWLGLGVDESYMVAAGRSLQLSYFDHPPLAWWMAWAAAHLTGTEAPWAVRLPFVITFAISTWLMFQLGTQLFNTCAGLWAAALMNAAPVLGVTTGAWVLPDGPLTAALLGTALCLAHAIRTADGSALSRSAGARKAWAWWAAVGICAGLALLSKYSAGLTIVGSALFLLSSRTERAWLSRPHPYVALLIALTIFSPAVVWNAEHGWVSLLFQGGRAHIVRLHLFGPLSSLGGEALFLLPWIWLPLVACAVAAAIRGINDRASWLLLCLALPPIVLFTIVSLWTNVLFHWAMPGYLMLFPLLGEVVGRYRSRSRAVRIWLIGNAVVVSMGVLFVASEVRFNWLPEVLEDFAIGSDPDVGAVDWTSVVYDLDARKMLERPGLVVAATRWFDAGKIDYALRGRVPVTVLGPDQREYGLTTRVREIVGHDVLFVTPKTTLEQLDLQFGRLFDYIEPLPPIVLRHAGRPAMVIPVFLGHYFSARPLERLRT